MLREPDQHYTGYNRIIDYFRRAKPKGVSYATRYLFHGAG